LSHGHRASQPDDLRAAEGDALGGEGEGRHGGYRIAHEREGLREEGDIVSTAVDLVDRAGKVPHIERRIIPRGDSYPGRHALRRRIASNL
jgi:hypothetical protein